MRITAGSLRGREIPFSNKKYRNADITPQKMKEAVFSIIGSDIQQAKFLELFGCSGQMSYEAFSRGASSVVVNEKDFRRFTFIKSMVQKFVAENIISVYNQNAFSLLKKLKLESESFDYIYLDPPYVKQKGEAFIYSELLSAISDANLLKADGVIFVQYFTGNKLPSDVKNLSLLKNRVYGTSSLAEYSLKK